MKLAKFLVTAVTVAVIATPALANDQQVVPPAVQKSPIHHYAHHHHMAPGAMPFFDKMDTNHDGVISKDEWSKDADDKFAEIDANHDGKITRAEMEHFHHTMMEKHPEWARRHGAPPPPPVDQAWDHRTTWVHHSEYSEGNRPNMAAPGVSTSAPPSYNEVDPDRRPAGADGAGGWTAQ